MEARPPDSVQVADYGAMLRRRWWVLALGALVGLLLAVEMLMLSSKTYLATAGVLVLPTGVDNGSVAGGRTGGEINLDTEAQLLTSVDVATRAKALLKVPDEPRDLAANVSVAVPPNTSVLNISYSAPTPEDAQRSAQAFAQAYLDSRAAVATAKLKTEAEALQGQIAAARKNLQEVTGKKAALPETSPDRADADAQEKVLINRITELSGDLSPIEAALVAKVQPGRVINSPKLPAAPTDPNPKIYLPSGLLLGLLIGLGFATLLQRVDKRVHNEADLRRTSGLPVLTAVPINRLSSIAAGISSHSSPAGQAFRRLRNLLVSKYPGSGQIVLVAGVAKGVSGSLVAANLASTLARAGSDTILVCADLRSRSTLPLVGLDDDKGLAEVLIGSTELAKVRRSVPGLPRLQVIGPGMVDAEEWVQSEALVDLLQQLQQERSAFVVVEAPPTSMSADAQGLAALADVVILAVEGRHTLRRDVTEAIDEFDRVGAEVLGSVLVAFTRRVIRQARRQSSAPAPVGTGTTTRPAAPDLGIDETMPISEQLAAEVRRRVTADVPRR
jgi:Mrp family chromosome partitioning ATPase/capsular polysaccharide biosynthesis protein